MSMFQRICTTVFLLAVLGGCASLPEEIQHSPAPQTAQSRSTLSEMRDSAAQNEQWQSSGTSAVFVQDTGWDALAQRLALIESAEHSIDIQYYIWNSDVSGHYLASRLLEAANRGVQIRVMLDDINLNEREALLIALDSHPNVQIRIFNPIPSRRGAMKWLNVLGDFSRLNRRMHNKSFTVDGTLSIVGGRNIGDEYFDLSSDINFRDRDVMVMGAVVSEIQASYREYWDSRWSYPVELLGESNEAEPALDEISAPIYKNYPELPQGHQAAKHYLETVMGKMTWVKAEYYSDQPVPVDEKNSDVPKATALKLSEIASHAKQEILLESAYLVFDDGQLQEWNNLTTNGVEVKALTNSMASNDLVTNHSAYAGRRQDILENGVQLFELKPDSKLCEISTKDKSKCAPVAAYGLHTKSIVFDSEISVIGSFNFNLRSTYLNTESILVIESDALAENLAKDMSQAMSEENSWRLDLEGGDVHWHSGPNTWDSEPETGKWERVQSGFLQLLPIEKYL
ncbi:phospholipase D family protein [Vibrio sp. T187]|uniref:phospholipase D family protein n=1 Tax=Vibrio TaxID=662 RepID=UPI0010C9AA36|nr:MULTISPECIES: phospholipase D family protein [Vibrio]MBW3695764.1 phospholipase D family protein [Vibrio sp. T187]